MNSNLNWLNEHLENSFYGFDNEWAAIFEVEDLQINIEL